MPRGRDYYPARLRALRTWVLEHQAVLRDRPGGSLKERLHQNGITGDRPLPEEGLWYRFLVRNVFTGADVAALRAVAALVLPPAESASLYPGSSPVRSRTPGARPGATPGRALGSTPEATGVRSRSPGVTPGATSGRRGVADSTRGAALARRRSGASMPGATPLRARTPRRTPGTTSVRRGTPAGTRTPGTARGAAPRRRRTAQEECSLDAGGFVGTQGHASGQADSCLGARDGVTTREECGLDAEAEASALEESCAGGGSDASVRGDASFGGARWDRPASSKAVL